MKRHQTITAIIIDDEPLARTGLRDILKEEKDFVIVAEAGDGEEALQLIERYKPQVLFLDIQMPEFSGFDIINNLPDSYHPLIVFVTAYNEYALQAFSKNALDYLLKPFDAERIGDTLNRIREMIHLKQSAAYSTKMVEALKQIHTPQNYLTRIPIRSAGKIRLVSLDDVLWIEADADYIQLQTAGGKHTTRETIGRIEKILDPAIFVRIHRSIIVNVHHVREIRTMHHGEYEIILDQGTKLTASRSYKQKLDFLIP